MKRSEEFKSLLSSVPEPHVWGAEYVRGKYMLMCALESEGSLECCSVAREILDKFGEGVVVPENIVLGCYDCLARHGDFESYMIALEWNRPMEKKFYLPRAKVLKRHGVIDAFQELQDGLLDLLVLETPPRVGKLLWDKTEVLTRNGWKRHGDLVVGDMVLNDKGKFVRVLGVSRKDKVEYKVTFGNGEVVYCHGNHEWVVYDRHKRNTRVVETREMVGNLVDSYEKKKKRYRFFVPLKDPVVGEHKNLKVAPYALGTQLGYGVCIKEEYLTARLEDRLEILAGLIDTSGSLDKGKHRYSCVVNDKLVRDCVVELISTFGWRVCVSKYQPRVSSSGIHGRKVVYTISFNPTMYIPCRLERKQLREFSRQRRIAIEMIEPVKEEMQGNCIQVEGGVYLVGKQLIPTHNSTLSLMFITMRAALYPDDSILGNGHSSALTRSFYNEFLNLVTSDEYRFSEIFPNISISNKNAEDNYVDFNNDKRFHTAMFKSVDGGTTGLAEASNLLYCDDMVKDVETANSKDRLDKLYYNYTSSIKDRKVSRLRKDGKYHSAPELWVATPWSIYDPMSRVIANELERNNESRVKIVAIPCWDENHNSNFMYDYGKGFDTRYYEEMQLAEDPVIFSAKYLMKPIERDGRPFERDSLTYFTELPVDDDGNIKKPDRIVAYNDVSHGGDDFMSMPIAWVYGRDVYIVDVLFIHKFNGDAYSRPLVCKKLIDNKVQSCGFEKNNGGDFYESLIHNDLVNMNYRCNTIAFNAPTTKSKLDRILSCQADIHGDSPIEDFYRVMFRNPKSIPVNSEYMAFLNNIWNWSQKEGRTQKRQHDDGVDSVAGLLINMLGKHMRGGYNIYDIRDAGY